jgi:hypothetical protein
MIKSIIALFIIIFIGSSILSIRYSNSQISNLGFPKTYYTINVMQAESGIGTNHSLIINALFFNIFISLAFAFVLTLIRKKASKQ